MKKLMISFIAIIFLSVALISWKSVADGAAVINDFGCGMFDGNGNFVFTDMSHAVVTSSGNGMIRCEATVGNTTGQAVVYSGFECGTFAGVTTQSHETVSASGQATLICHFNSH
ncbi:hypothetical protein ACPPVU_07750 [Mucilaginibacter sp. McL0603]|uniref:hypothetical protein n=1 Tax=Mucilaginibacter sp. McL0603 TaxID=3415670 RepID=UPI003CF300D4